MKTIKEKAEMHINNLMAIEDWFTSNESIELSLRYNNDIDKVIKFIKELAKKCEE